MPKHSKAKDTQVGGDHYKGLEYQPFHLALDCSGSPAFIKAAKYLTREKNDRKENLRKAYHCIQLEQEYRETDGINIAVSEHVKRVRAHIRESRLEHVQKFCKQFKNGHIYETILMCIIDRNYSKAKENLTKFVRYGRWEEI